MSKIKELNVQGSNVRFLTHNGLDYVCITDIAALKNPLEPKDVVKNWLRSRSTLSFIGLWEKLHNPDFKGVDFDPFKKFDHEKLIFFGCKLHKNHSTLVRLH